VNEAWLVREGVPDKIPLGREASVGRDESNPIRLDDRQVSRKHALIVANPEGGFVLSDLGSANGTFVNGRRLVAPRRLRTGDVLTFGDLRFEFHEKSAPPAIDRPAEDGGQTTSRRGVGQDAVLIGRSAAMQEVFRLITQASSSEIPVLIEGETGTGKELVAQGVHASSARAGRTFRAINCAAIPESLLESELFGHRRGAFTGASTDRCGLFEDADGGTIFLDEIGEMPLAMQPKLLRVLQEGEVTRIGDTKGRRIDVRIVSATNRDLLADIDGSRFRADLYYRLSAFPVRLPSLRERREDIPLLCDVFLGSFSRSEGKKLRGIAPEAMNALLRFGWPGNVRELRNEIQRAVAVAGMGQMIELTHLSEKILADRPDRSTDDTERHAASSSLGSPEDLRRAREAFERQHIIQVLAREGNVVSRAADALGLTRPGLHKKLKEFGLR
jgi:transcriptional regulator with PAS, ATPase and Fis domain